MSYLDANIFVRLITNDQPAMTEAARRLFARLADDEQASLLDATVAEVVYVLGSRAMYNLPRNEIRAQLRLLLSYRGVRMEHKERCFRSLDLFATNPFLNYADCMVVAAAEEDDVPVVYSFDLGFDRVSGISRLEP